MRAVRLVQAKKLAVKEIAEPKKDDERVLIDVVRAGICGSDIHYWDVGAPEGLVMGHEFSGVVTHAGSRKDLKVGDRVTALPISPCGGCEACESGNPQFCLRTWDNAIGLSLTCSGGFAPRLSAQPNMVIRLPENVSFEEGAMVEPTAVGLHAVHLAKIEVGDKVLVVGGGIIGLVSAMFAKMQGAKLVVVSETNPYRGKKAVKLDVADDWLDAKAEDFNEKAVKLSAGGFDKVIDCCGNAPAVNSALMVTKNGGRVVLAGVSMTPINFMSVLAVMHELDVQGAIGYTKKEFETVIDLIDKRQIDVKKFISRTVSLDEVQASFEELTNGKTTAIKILVDPNKTKHSKGKKASSTSKE